MSIALQPNAGIGRPYMKKPIVNGLSVALLWACILLFNYLSTTISTMSMQTAAVCALAAPFAMVIWHRGDDWPVGDWVYASLGGVITTFILLMFDCNGRFPNTEILETCPGLHDGSVLFTIGAAAYLFIAVVGVFRALLLKLTR